MKIGGQQIPTRTILLALSESVLVFLGLLAVIAVGQFARAPGPIRLTAVGLAQIALVALTYELFLYYTEIYDLQLTRNRSAMMVRLLQAFGTSCLFLALVYAYVPALKLQKGVVIVATPLVMAMIFGWRRLLSATGVMSRRSERVAVLGTGAVGIAVVREVCARPELNWNVVGFLDQDPRNVGKPLVNPGIIATIADLKQVVRNERIDRIMISLKEGDQMPVGALMQLKLAGIVVEDASSVLERLTGRLTLEDPAWLIRASGFRRSRLLTVTKRLIDVLLASVMLLITLPILVAVGLFIVAESGFPFLFRQKRIGLARRPFEIVKFRSMYRGSEDRGPMWATDGDARITRVGRLIRKYRLDELPQIWNVLRGDMSLVGPRPEQPYFCDVLEERIPFFDQRHQVRPGITGWAQIKHRYSGSVEDSVRKVELDLFYIKHMSLALDFVILLETVKVVIWARGSK
jgi:sugar transferase (PEP-CTERM system associated)